VISLQELERIAEIEFSGIVYTTELMASKLRIVLKKGTFIDVWLSRKIPDRFGFHWEDKTTGLSYRYDNFPNTKWKHVSTYPYHFHDGSQDNVIDSSKYEKSVEEGFRGFMRWVSSKL